MTTLAVVRGWGDDPEAAVPLLREALDAGAAAGLHRGVVAGEREP